MKLDDLQPAPGAHKRRKKIGRGPGSGHGKTSGRGHKGDKARGSGRPGFEGGQTPLNRRLPKQRGLGVGLTARGFNTGRYKTHYVIVNVSDLDRLEAGTVVTPELLRAKGMVRKADLPVKVLADGKLSKALTVKAHKFSQGAQAAIETAGGSTEVI